jgi:hypothetical protein
MVTALACPMCAVSTDIAFNSASTWHVPWMPVLAVRNGRIFQQTDCDTTKLRKTTSDNMDKEISPTEQ